MPPDPVPNPPVIDWPFWYQFGSPGPTWGCDSGTTPTFDNNGILDNSLPTVFNLTPATSYSCKTLAGELSWDFPSKTLTVKGTIYIDGSVKVEQSWGGQHAARYQGQGTIYMSGSFLMNGPVKLCAVVDATGKDCNFATNAWDPNVDALIFVAKSRGTDPGIQATAGNHSVEVTERISSRECSAASTTSSAIRSPPSRDR